jgi:hypothetical protein
MSKRIPLTDATLRRVWVSDISPGQMHVNEIKAPSIRLKMDTRQNLPTLFFAPIRLAVSVGLNGV